MLSFLKKEDDLALFQQLSHNAEPFRIEGFPADGLACPT
jgi:hypothetical protein